MRIGPEAMRNRLAIHSAYAAVVLGCALQAQTFNPVPALSFVKAFGGANPLPQVITITSTGNNLAFDDSATTTSGGSWLSITSCGSFCTTPEAITVTVNASTTLAAGTYGGQIVVNKHGDTTNKITIPVALHVAASGSSFFDDLPGQLSFSLVPGGNRPPGQSVEVFNGGTGTLNWTSSTSTADGGNWISVSSSSGAAPSRVVVSVQTGSLPGGGFSAGTFIGQVVFHAAGDNVTIPVSVTVGASVFQQVNPLSFTKVFGGANPLPQVVTVASTNAQFAFDSVAVTGNGGAWLQVTSCGSFCTTPEAITVTVNASLTLAAGTYTGQIVFTTHGTRSMAMTVPVTLTIAASGAAVFDNAPGQLSFSLIPGGTAPPAQTVQIHNAGGGTLTWTAVPGTADGHAWLVVSPLTGPAPSTVTVSVSPATLPGGGIVAGSYVGQIAFQAPGSIVTIPVVVQVGDSVFRQTNPINFTKPFGGANPLTQVLSIASTGATFAFDSVVNTGNGGAWLQITSCGSFCVTPEAISVSVNPAVTLAAGIYTGQITFTAHGTRSLSMTVAVTLTISAAGTAFFDNVPGQISFSFQTGTTGPPPQTLQIRNAGTGTLNWSATVSTADGAAWLAATPLTGNAPSTITISITPTLLPGGGLTAGTFTGQIEFTAAGSSVTVPVSVLVGDSVFRQVNPLSFTKPFGGADPLPQVISIASTGSNFAFDSAVVNAKGGAWLKVTSCGSFCTTPEAITVTVTTAATLAAGTYTGEITFTAHGNRAMAMSVPVTLYVKGAAATFFDNMPGQMTFLFQTGTTGPPAQPVQIRDGGAGTLTWTASATTADGGSWLRLSTRTGTAPSTVNVSIVPASLPGQGLVAGTFTGQVSFSGPGSTATLPVTVTVGDSVFRQVNPIAFVKPFGGANPLPQVLDIASTGTNLAFDSVAITANGGAWLQITSCGSFCTTPEAITVTPNPAVTLAAGTYTGEITFTTHGTRNMSMTVPVTLTVALAGTAFFDNTPGQMSFSFQTATTGPPSQSVQIRNGGTGTLSWTATTSTGDGGNWLALTPKSGTATSTAKASIVPSSLPGGGLVAGTFVGLVTFNTPGGGSVTIPVAVQVGDSVFRQVNPISFTKHVGGANSLPQFITVASTGTNFAFDSVTASANGASWLQVTSCGSFCTTPEVITVTANPSVTLAAGVYTAEIIFTAHGTRTLAMTVPVTLNVAASGTAFFDNVIGQVSFSMVPGTANPPSRKVQLRNEGSGALSWTGSTSTADGGLWLTLSPLTGTAPAAVTVGVNTLNLPGGGLVAGTFVGLLSFQTTGNSVTIPVSVTVDNNVFVQVSGLSFSKVFGLSNPPPQKFTVSSSGTNFAFDSVTLTGNGGSWLQSTSCGSFCTTPESITATIIAPSTLPVGTYTGQITFTSHGTRAMGMTVPITLKVTN
jgi:hypothetical protein